MLGLMLSAVLLAQAAPAADAEVRAISLTVLDAKGDAVEGLGAKDVALLENGVARDITAFGPDLRSLTAAVIVDTSEVVSSAYRLNMVEPVVGLVARLPEGSRYAIWTTGDRPTKILDYTDDRAAASKALKLVAPRGGNYMLDALAEISTLGLVALDELLSPDRNSAAVGDLVPDRKGTNPEAAFQIEEMKRVLADAINRLPERERLVVTLYYYEGLTLAEIGSVLGVTESRVCQIHTKSVISLRNRMTEPSFR